MKLIVFPRVKFKDEVVRDIFEKGKLDNYKDFLKNNRLGIRRDGVLIALAEDDVVDIVPLVIYEAYKHGFLPYLEQGYGAEDFREFEVYDLVPSKPWGLGGIVTDPWNKDFVYYKQKQIVLLAKFFGIMKEPLSKEITKRLSEIGNELKKLKEFKFEK